MVALDISKLHGPLRLHGNDFTRSRDFHELLARLFGGCQKVGRRTPAAHLLILVLSCAEMTMDPQRRPFRWLRRSFVFDTMSSVLPRQSF